MSSATRTEKDSLGELAVPADAMYGVQTLRAVQNFPISGMRPLPAFVDAVVRIKRAAALTHKETGRLDARLADAIIADADQGYAGTHRRVRRKREGVRRDCEGRPYPSPGRDADQARPGIHSIRRYTSPWTQACKRSR